MDSARYVHLARSFRAIASRRSVLALLTALGMGGASGLPQRAASKRKRRKRGNRNRCVHTCGLCRTCKRGKCKARKPSGMRCGDCALCQGRGCVSYCRQGQACSGGVCGEAPICLARDAFCTAAGACCSGDCVDEDGDGILACACSPAGTPCLLTGDCCEGTCTGFVCIT